MSDLITILVADDDQSVIDNLCSYFSFTEDIEVIGTATDGIEALKKVAKIRPDVVLSDVHMTHMNGIELLRNIRELDNPPRFIAMTGIDTDGTMLETLTEGGSGYIIKSQPFESIINAIRDSLNGGTTISANALSRLVRYIPLAAGDYVDQMGRATDLNATETRVLTCLCDGMSNSEIATKLNYSESSIKRIVSDLMRYYNASSRLKLVITALQSGWR